MDHQLTGIRRQTEPIDLDDIVDGLDWKSTSDASSAPARASPNAVSSPSLFEAPFAHSLANEEVHLSFFSEWRVPNNQDETINNKDCEQPLVQRNVADYEVPLLQNGDSACQASTPRPSNRCRMFFSRRARLISRKGIRGCSGSKESKDSGNAQNTRKRGLFSRRRLDSIVRVVQKHSIKADCIEPDPVLVASSKKHTTLLSSIRRSNERNPSIASPKATEQRADFIGSHLSEKQEYRGSSTVVSFRDPGCEFSFDFPETAAKDFDEITLRVSNNGNQLDPPLSVRDHPSFDDSFADRVDLFDLLYEHPADDTSTDNEDDSALRLVMARLDDYEKQDTSQGHFIDAPFNEDRVLNIPSGNSTVPVVDLGSTSTKPTFLMCLETEDNYIRMSSSLGNTFEQRSDADADDEESFSVSVDSIGGNTPSEVVMIAPTDNRFSHHCKDRNSIQSSRSLVSARFDDNITNSTLLTYYTDEDHYRRLSKCHLDIKDVKIRSLECKIESMRAMSDQERSPYAMQIDELKSESDDVQARQSQLLEQLRKGIDSKDKIITELCEKVASLETELNCYRQNGLEAIQMSLQDELNVERQRIADFQRKYDQSCRDHEREILQMRISHQETVDGLQVELEHRHSCIENLADELCMVEVKLEQADSRLSNEKQNALLVSRYKEQAILEIEESHVAELTDLCRKLESKELTNKMLTAQIIALEASMEHFCSLSDISI